MPMPRAGGIINCQIENLQTLYACYMPFVTGGAIFVRHDKPHKLGQDVFVVLTLPDSPERMPINGKVVWINHRSQGKRPAGFAVQLPNDETGKKLQAMIEEVLKPFAGSERPTFTL